MTSKRTFFLLAFLLLLTVAGMVGGAYAINSTLSQRSSKLVALKAQSQALDQEQLTLNNTKKEIQKYAGLEQIVSTVVPQDKDQAEAVREIANLAAENNVILGAITFPTSTLGSGLTSVPSASTAVTPAPAPTAVNLNSTANKLSQLSPVKSIPGVYALTITVQSSSKETEFPLYSNFLNYLQALEKNRRTSEITGISISPDTRNPNQLSFTLTLEDYIKP